MRHVTNATSLVFFSQGQYNCSAIMADVRVNMDPSTSTGPSTTDQSKKPSHGWTADARKLVKMWAGQMAVNRLRHQQNADEMGRKSTSMKVATAVFGALATFIAFLATTFTSEPYVIIGMNIGAGLCAAIATLIGVIGAIYELDSEAEKNRQTAIQYANVCNEAQTVLVEEHEENLPQATEFLRRMKDLTHLIQLFGPSLEAQSTDMPSMILLHGIRKISGSNGAPPADNAVADEYAGIFDHDDKFNNSPMVRKKKRADMLDALKRDRDDITRRQEELIAEENELKALSQMLSMQAVLGTDARDDELRRIKISANMSAPAVTHYGVSSVQSTTVQPTIVQSTMAQSAPSMITPVSTTPIATPVTTKVSIRRDLPTVHAPAMSAPDDTSGESCTEESTEDASEVTHQAVVGDRISPVVRSSIRDSTFPRDNIAQLEHVPTSNSGSCTQSGENFEEAMSGDGDHRTLTAMTLGTIGKISAGVKKMQIAPEVLRAEIRRREDKIKTQKQELADKKRINNNMRRRIKSTQEESRVMVNSAQRPSAGILNRTGTLVTVDRRDTSGSLSFASQTNNSSPRPGVINRIKGVLTPQSSPTPDIDVVQREKLDAIREICGDDLSFECMRDDN